MREWAELRVKVVALLLAQVNNVAELLLVRGLAQVVRHRGDEERSGGATCPGRLHSICLHPY